MTRARHACLILSGLLALHACAVTPGLHAGLRPSLVLDAVNTVGRVTLEGKLAITPSRGLLAVVNPWVAADIDHVRLELLQGTTSKGILTVGQAQLNTVVRFNNLLPNTAYTIQARAWQDAGETVPVDNFDSNAASCTTVFSTANDTVMTVPGGIALRLRDKAFSGLGAGAIAVTAGGWMTAGTEAIALRINGGVVSTLAGSTSGFADGTGAAAQFQNELGLAADRSGNVYVADPVNHRIRKVTPSGVVTTLAGSTQGFADGVGAVAQFDTPYGVAVDSADNVYVADTNNHRIRKVTPSGVVSTLAGATPGYANGTGVAALFFSPTGVAVDAAGNVYVADLQNYRIRKVTPAGVVSTLAGAGTQGSADGTGASASFNNPVAIASDGGGTVFVADVSLHNIRKVTPAGVVTTLAGSAGNSGYVDGAGTSAHFDEPRALSVDPAGNLYVADFNNHRIRKVAANGVVSSLAGSALGFADGTGAAAQFNGPTGVAMDAAGNLYVGDSGNNRIRKVQ